MVFVFSSHVKKNLLIGFSSHVKKGVDGPSFHPDKVPQYSKCQHFKLRGHQFHYIKWLKKGIPNLKSWHFEVSEDIITKFKSQGLYIIRIKYWNASGSGPPPSLIPTLWNIGILHCNQAKLPKHLQHSVSTYLLL